MRIEFKDIILRDMIESDIEDYVRWFTIQREWENWDAPWEKEDTCQESEHKKWTEYYETAKKRSDDTRRLKFEIEWNNRHIGWSVHIILTKTMNGLKRSKMVRFLILLLALIFVSLMCMEKVLEQTLFVPL